MSWRTVVVSSHCKLDLKMGCMVIRGDDIRRISLDEISMVLVESTAVSITGCLISELTRRKIRLIFCDEKYNPCAELTALYGSYDCSAKLRTQIKWSSETKAFIWTAIVTEKIRNQALHLDALGYNDEAEILYGYISEMELNDESNREGHAAKVYFNALFGQCFSRNNDNSMNAALNYGYSLILSAVNREVCACGYLTQLGLFHDNMFNHFNLSCDLMEPFRVLIDRIVAKRKYNIFGTDEKHELVKMFFETQVIVAGQEQYIQNAIKIYCRSVFDALNSNDSSLIRFFHLGEDKKE